jgi:hypothetical protein
MRTKKQPKQTTGKNAGKKTSRLLEKSIQKSKKKKRFYYNPKIERRFDDNEPF